MTNPQSDPPEGGGQAGSVDAGLVELEKQRSALLQATEPGDEKAGEAALQEPLSDEGAEERIARVDEVERQIAAARAQGLEGVAVKLRVAVSLLEETKDPEAPDLPEMGCTRTAVETVERLLKGGVAADAKVVSLEREYIELLAKLNAADKDEESDAFFEQAVARIDRMTVTQAHTPTGIAAKLRIVGRYASPTDVARELSEPDLLLSALHDLERLSGSFVPTAGDDAEVFRAYEEWKRLYQEWRDACKSISEREGDRELERKADAAWITADEAETRFLYTPARTVAGLLLKLKVGCEPRNYDVEYVSEGDLPSGPSAVLSVLRDLERLAGRPATVATVDATSGRIPSIPVLHNIPAGHSTLVVEDPCFAPLILEGDTVVIAPGQSRLDSGAFYAIKREGKTQIWLADEGGASLPGDYKTEVWLLTLNEPFRWAGPCDRQEVKTIGRVVGLLDKDRPLALGVDPILVHEAEWQWLHRQYIVLKFKYWRLHKTLPERVRDDTLAELTPCERKARWAEREAEAEKIGLADVERRIAPLSARKCVVDTTMSLVPASTPAGARAKLQMLWQGEYEQAPDMEGDWECQIVRGAIKALGGDAFFMRWTEEAVRARYGHLED